MVGHAAYISENILSLLGFQSNTICVSLFLALTMESVYATTFLPFFKDFIYLFLERGEGREKERVKNINVWLSLMHPLLGTWPATQACALTGN